ncbi:DUF1294 domain-containing protein [Lachnospiraceae bacterium NSJ-143]|nr:DUF1294 domain-containing protein [Lachnospiraceae bacterium NSJ-143]
MAAKAIVLYYLSLNLALFILMGYDKRCAVKGKWRIPESTLFIFSLLGGAAGGFAGMYLFHHKSRKWSFRIIYCISLLVHIALVYYIFKNHILFLPAAGNDFIFTVTG